MALTYHCPSREKADTFKLVVLQNILHDVNEIFVVFRHDSLKKLTLLDVDSIKIKKIYS